MKLTKTHKIIIGIVGLGIVAYATKKYWMPKKGIEIDVKQDVVGSLGGDANDSDPIGQQYSLLSNYKAMNTKTMKDVDFKSSDKFVKKNDRNATMINNQSAIKVFALPSGVDEYIIPTSILKKQK